MLGRVARLSLAAVLGSCLTVVTQMTGVAASAAAIVGDTPEASWQVNGRVYATEIVGNTVFVGGNFSSAISPSGQSVARRNLAAFSMSTGALLTQWRADAGATVRALVSDGTWLYVGGAFGRVGGEPRSRLAKVDVATGAVDASFAPSFNNTVRALDIDETAVYAGGPFTAVNGVTRNRVAKVSQSTGAVDTQFTASANGAVWGVAKNPSSSVVYVSGPFSALNGVARNGVGALSSVTGATTSVVFGSAARPTLGLDVNDDGTRLFGAGGTGGNAMATWNTSTGVRLWRQVAMGDIQAVEYHRGMVYFGFHDGYQDDTRLKVLAADAVTGVVDPNFRPRFNNYWGVFAIAVTDAGVVVGGDFTQVSGVAAQGWARFLASGDLPPAPVTTRYLTSTSPWRYWDRGTRPTNWQAPGFDDSAWASGVPQLGYGDGDEATVVSYGPNASDKYITTYFRTTFQVPEIPDTATVQLMADDGAVVYVNGTEVVRDNMPTGTITNTTRASTGRAGGDENAMRPFDVPVQHLQTGTNVVAVEVHQAAPSSSDLSFDLDLSGESTSDTEETADTEDPPPPEGDTVTTEVVTEGASWRWRYDPPAPQEGWMQTAFDASAWAEGPAPLGWGTAGPIATNIDSYPDTQDRPRAAYFRTSLTIDSPASVVSLRLTTVADDGVVVYVNGTEVARSNMPTGTITHLTYAPSAINTATANANPVVIDVPVALLRHGVNVIAGQTHVNYRATPNLSFKLSAELTHVR